MQQPQVIVTDIVDGFRRVSLTEGVHAACEVCLPLTNASESPIRKFMLENSAHEGCSICILFWRVCLLAGDISHVETITAWRHDALFGLNLRPDEDENLSARMPWAPVLALAVNGEISASPFPWLPVLSKSPFSRTPVRDVQMAALWLQECQQSHVDCQQLTAPQLPARVIDVGSPEQDPFLLVTFGRPGRYLCLSHRWGISEQFRTTVESLPSHCQNIPFGEFPLLFQQAIEMTRALGIRYLWIDSLCIVQDDQNDWERESASMGAIYENAYATLFAERAAHSADSLFYTAEDQRRQEAVFETVPYQNPVTGETHPVLVSSRFSSYPSSLETAFCSVDRSRSHLEDRGWIMQEEILSRRKLCFSDTELHWQCNRLSQCECGLRSIMSGNADNEHHFIGRLLRIRRDDGTVTRALTKSESIDRRGRANLRKEWQRLIKIYSTRSLSDEQDRLTALAGVASRVGRPYEHYLAGMWRQDTEFDLLWHAKIDGYSRPCRRHSCYAPTWSWASVTGSVDFNIYETFETLWQVRDGKCTPSGRNPLGPVSSGRLTISARMVPVNISTARESYPYFTDEILEADWERGSYCFHPSGPESPGWADCLLMSVDSTSHNLAGHYLTMDTPEDWYEVYHSAGKAETKYLYVIAGVGSRIMGPSVFEIQQAVTAGLLVRESAKEPGRWERVCLAKPDGWWPDWEAVSVHETIDLI